MYCADSLTRRVRRLYSASRFRNMATVSGIVEGQRALRIGVIGAGRIGRRHAALTAANPRAHLVAIADPDPAAVALADELGATWSGDLDGLLRIQRPDGLIIATPNDMHLEHAMQCLAAGVPALIEKPVATTVADGERIAAEAEKAGVRVLVGHHRRHSPYLTTAVAAIKSGQLGTLVAASATTMFSKPAAYFEKAPWRRHTGGGPILINLIHDVDALRMLVGDIAAVRAVSSDAVRGRGVESVAVSLRFTGGAVGSMLLSDTAAAPLSWEMTSGEDAAYPHYAGREAYVVAGTRGTLGIPSMRLTIADGTPSWHDPMLTMTLDVRTADPLERQLDHFLDVIARGIDPVSTARDAVESLRVTLAVADAARTGQAVELQRRPGKA